MEKIEYLPIGSVVYLKNGFKKVMVIGRGMVISREDQEVFFDYCAVQFPEGLLGDEVAYFQHDDIEKVVFTGLSDEDDQMVIKKINNYLLANRVIERG